MDKWYNNVKTIDFTYNSCPDKWSCFFDFMRVTEQHTAGILTINFATRNTNCCIKTMKLWKHNNRIAQQRLYRKSMEQWDEWVTMYINENEKFTEIHL